MKQEPIAFRDDVTVKWDGGGVAFSLDTMHRQQAIAIIGEYEPCGRESTEKSHGLSTRTTASALDRGGGREREIVYWEPEENDDLSERDRDAEPRSASGQL